MRESNKSFESDSTILVPYDKDDSEKAALHERMLFGLEQSCGDCPKVRVLLELVVAVVSLLRL